MSILDRVKRLWTKPTVRDVKPPFFSNAAFEADRGAGADARFAACITEVLKHEGGYVNDPEDPGGETRYGISKRSYPRLDIPNLTIDDAKAIYRRDFWPRVFGDDLPPGLNLAAFDYAVNSGPGRAIPCLQRAVGVRDDGVFGPATLAAVRRVPDVGLAIRHMCDDRRRFLRSLPTYPRFGRGWERRVDDVLRAGLVMNTR
jgi:lysozyme family protein